MERPGAGVRYFLCGVLAWLVVDFTTTPAIAHPRAYYSHYGAVLLLFYLGYPLAFTLLRYRWRLGPKALFASMLAGIFVVEIVLAHNMLLVTPPVCLLAIPLALAHYSMVTFVPLWVAEGTLQEHRVLAAVVAAGWAIGVLLNAATQFGAHH